MNILNFISDAGHGWLEIPLSALHQAGIDHCDLSGCSYLSDTHAYLEEDCDADLYMNAVGRESVQLNRIEIYSFPYDYRDDIRANRSNAESSHAGPVTPGLG